MISTPPEIQATSSEGPGVLQGFWQKITQSPTYLKHELFHFVEKGLDLTSLMDYLQQNRFSNLIGIYRCALIQVIAKNELTNAERQLDFQNLLSNYSDYRLETIPFDVMLGLSPSTVTTPPPQETIAPQVVYVPQIPFVDQLFDFFREINFRDSFQEALFQAQPSLVVRIKRIYNFMLKLEKVLLKVEQERLSVAVFYPQLQELFTDLFNLDIDILPLLLAQVPQLKALFQSVGSLSGFAEDADVLLEIQKYLSAEQFVHFGGQLGFWSGLLLSQSHAEYQSVATVQSVCMNLYAAMDGLSESCQKLSVKLALSDQERQVKASPDAQRLSKLQQSTTSFLGEKHKVSNLGQQLFNPQFLEKLGEYVNEVSGHIKDIVPLSAAGGVLNQITAVGINSFSALVKIQQVIALVKMIIKLVSEYPSHLKMLQGSYNDVLMLLLMHLKYDVLMQGIAYVDLLQNNLFLKPTSAEGETSLSSVVEIHFQHLYQSLVLYLSPICDFSDNKYLEILFDAGFNQKRQELAINNLSHLHGQKLEIDTIDAHLTIFASQIAALNPVTKSFYSISWSKGPYALPVGEQRQQLQQNFVIIYPLLQKVNAPFAEKLRIALQADAGKDTLQDIPNLSDLGHHVSQIKAQNEFQKLVLNQFLKHLARSNQQGLFFLECPDDVAIDYHKLFKLVRCNYAIIKVGEYYYFLNQFKARLYPLSADITPNLAIICQKFMNKPWIAFRFSEENCLQVLDLFGQNKANYLDKEDDFIRGLVSTTLVSEIEDISPEAVLRQGRFGEKERTFKHNMISLIQSMQLIEEENPTLNRAQLLLTSLPTAQKDKLLLQLRKISSSEEINLIAPQRVSFLDILKALSKKLEGAKVGSSVSVNFSDITPMDYDDLINHIKFGKFIKLFDEDYHQLSAQEIIELYDAYQSKIEHFNYHLQFCRDWFEELGKFRPNMSLSELSSAEFNRLWYLFNLAKPILQMAQHVDDWLAFERKLLNKQEIVANLISLEPTIYARTQPFFEILNQTQASVVSVYRQKVGEAYEDKLRSIQPDSRADKLIRKDDYSTLIGDLMARIRDLVNSHLSMELKSELLLRDDKAAYPIAASLSSVYKLPKQVADIMWAYNSLFHLRELARGFEEATGTQGLYHLPSQIGLIQKYFAFQNLFLFYRPSSLPGFSAPIDGQSRILKSKWLIKESLKDFFQHAGHLLVHYDLADPEINVGEMSGIQQLNLRSQHSWQRIINGVFLAPHLLDRYQQEHREPLPSAELRQLHEKHLKIGERVDAAWHPSWYFSIFEWPNLGRCIIDGIYLINHLLRSTKRLSYERFSLIRQEIFKIYAHIEALEIDCNVKQGFFLHEAESFFETFCQKTLQSLRVPIHDYIRLMSKMPMFEYRKQYLERELLTLTQDEQTFQLAKTQLDVFMQWRHDDEPESIHAFMSIIGLIEQYRHVRPDDPDLSPGLYRSNPGQLKLIRSQDEYFSELYRELRPYCFEQGDLGAAPDEFNFPTHFFNFIEILAAFIEGKLATLQLCKRIHENRKMSLAIKMGIIPDFPLDMQDINAREIQMMTEEKSRLVCGHFEYFKERFISLFTKDFEEFPLLHEQYQQALSLHFNEEFEEKLHHAALALPQNIEEYLNAQIQQHCESFDKNARCNYEKRRLILQRIQAFKQYLETLNRLGGQSLTEDSQSILQKLVVLNTLEQKITAGNIDFERLAVEIKDNYGSLTRMRQACGWMDKLLQFAVAVLEYIGISRSHRHCFFYDIYDASKKNMAYEKLKPKISVKEELAEPKQFALDLEKKFEPEKSLGGLFI